MLRKASAQIKSFASDHHCSRFIISYDADHDDPTIRRQVIVDRVIQPASVNGAFCALVPTQEIEAWILADLSAVSRVIQNWNYAGQFHHPEAIDDPKETLERLCKEYGRPRYIHAVHNEKVAAYLDFDVVACKCPSFRPLLEFVRTGKSNC